MSAEDDQLSHDVSLLGRLLGDVLREQEGEAGFALVEELRASTKALRTPDPDPPDFGPAGRALLDALPRAGRALGAPARARVHPVLPPRQRRGGAPPAARPAPAATPRAMAHRGRSRWRPRWRTRRARECRRGRGPAPVERPRRRARLHRAPDRGPPANGAAQAARAGPPRGEARRSRGSRPAERRSLHDQVREVVTALWRTDERRSPAAVGPRRGAQRPLLLRGVALERRAAPVPRPGGGPGACLSERAVRHSRRSCASARGWAATGTAIRT